MQPIEKIDLTQNDPQELSGHTSKGNQMKWLRDGFWYKADHMGYEGLAETAASAVLDGAVGAAFPRVEYAPAEIFYRGRRFAGCRSKNFLEPGWALIPLEKLYRQYTGDSLADALAARFEMEEKVRFLVDFVEQTTQLTGYGAYLTAVLELDAVCRNEDRHTNNLAVLYHAGHDRFAFCPIFDNGLSFFSDTTIDFPLEMPPEECEKRIEPKPFGRSFEEQLDAAESLYGLQLTFTLTPAALAEQLKPLAALYPQAARDRVAAVYRAQKRRLAYLFQTDG